MKSKSTLAILAALAIGAGSLQSGDWEQQQRWNEFNQQQTQWQAEFNRRNYEFEQESIREQNERIQEQNERRFRDLENRINRIYDFDFE